MKKFIFFLAVFLAGLLQVTILNNFRILTIKPCLLLIFVLIASLTFELRWALVFSLFAGIFKDIFSISAFGINTVLFLLWSFLIVRLSREISIENNVLRCGLVLIVTFLHDIFVGLIYVYSGNYVPLGIFLRIITVQPIYTALILPIVFKQMKPFYCVK